MPNSNHATAPEAEAVLLAQVNHCRRRLVWQGLVRRLVVLLAVGALFPLLVIVADHIWPDGLPRRLVTGAAQAWVSVLAAAVVVLVVASLWRRLNPVFAARVVERVGGIRHNSLVNALLLKRSPAGAYAYPAAAHQAAADVGAHLRSTVTEPGAVRTPVLVGVVVLAAWAVYALVGPKPIGPSLARFFGAEVAAPTATQLDWLRPGESEIVRAGEPLEIEFAVRGRVVEAVHFEIMDPTAHSLQPIARYALRPSEEGPANHWVLRLAPHEVVRDIRFRCTAGDASLSGLIPVQPLPVITDLEIELVPPAYTGWASRTVAGPDLDVLMGTRATFRIQANTPVREAVFVLHGERESRTRMSVDEADPHGMTLSVVLAQGGRYRVEFSDRWGVPCRDSPKHQIVVRPDRPPHVMVVVPAEDELSDGVLDVTRHPILAADARDDVRVADLALLYEQEGVAGRLEVRRAGDNEGSPGRGDVQTAALPLEAGDQMRVWFEARDSRVLPNGRAAPQTARSRELRLVRPSEPIRQQQSAEAAGRDSEPKHGAAAESSPGAGEGGESGSNAEEVSGQAGSAGRSEAAGENFEEELKKFVEEHGEMARDVGRRVSEASEPQRGAQDAESSEEDDSPEGPPSSASEHPRSETPVSGGSPCGEPGESGGGGRDGVGEAAAGSQVEQGGGSPQSGGANDSSDEGEPGGGAGAGEQGQDDTPGQAAAEASAAGGGQPVSGGGGEADGTAGNAGLEDPAKQDGHSATDAATPLHSGGLAETLDLLAMLKRGGVVDEERLIEMGWPATKAAGFVRALERLHAMSRRDGDLGALPKLYFDVTLGDTAVQPGAGLAADMATGTDPPDVRQDNMRKIAAPPEQHVPPHLQKLLDAYYRALAQREAPANR